MQLSLASSVPTSPMHAPRASAPVVAAAAAAAAAAPTSLTTIAPVAVQRDPVLLTLPVSLQVTLAGRTINLGRAAKLVWMTRRQPTHHTIHYVYALRMYYFSDRVEGMNTSAIVGTHWDASVAAEHKPRSANIAAEVMLAMSAALTRLGVEPRVAAQEARAFIAHCVQTTSMTANYAYNDDSVRKFVGLPLAGETPDLSPADMALAKKKLAELCKIMAIKSSVREVSVQDHNSPAILTVAVPRARDSSGRAIDLGARKDLPPWLCDDSVVGESSEFAFDPVSLRTNSRSKKNAGKPIKRDGWICDLILAGGTYPIVRTDSKQFATMTSDGDHLPITGIIQQPPRLGTNLSVLAVPSANTAKSFSEMMGLLDPNTVLSSAPLEPELRTLYQRLSGIPLKGILSIANITLTTPVVEQPQQDSATASTAVPLNSGLVDALSASAEQASDAMNIDNATSSTTTTTTTVTTATSITKSVKKPKKGAKATAATASVTTVQKRKTPTKKVAKPAKKSSLDTGEESEEEASDSSDDDDVDDVTFHNVAALNDDDDNNDSDVNDDDAPARRKKTTPKKRQLAAKKLKMSTMPKLLSIGAASHRLSYHYEEVGMGMYDKGGPNGPMAAVAHFEFEKNKTLPGANTNNDDDSSSTCSAAASLLLPASAKAPLSPTLFGDATSKMALLSTLPPTIAIPMGGGHTLVANIVVPDIHKRTLVELLTVPKRFGSDLTTFIKRQPTLVKYVQSKFTDSTLSVLVFTEQFVPANTWRAIVHDRDRKAHAAWEDGVQYGFEQLLALGSVPGKLVYMHIDEDVNASAPHVKMVGRDFGNGAVEWDALALKDFAVGESIGIYVARPVPGGHAELDGSASVRMLCMDVPDEHLAADNFAADGVQVEGVDGLCCISGDDEECRLISTLGKANHSDDPNAELLDVYDHDAHGVGVRATKPIKAGDFIELNYGPSYMKSLVASRTPIVKPGSLVTIPPPITDEQVASALGVSVLSSTTTTTTSTTTPSTATSVAEAYSLLMASEEQPL